MLLTLYVFCFSGLVLKTKLIDKLVTQIHSGNFLLSFGDEYLVETLVSLLHRSIKFAYRASLILNQTLSYRQIQLFSMIWDYSSGFKYDICFRQIELQFGFFLNYVKYNVCERIIFHNWSKLDCLFKIFCSYCAFKWRFNSY